jgi:hypothetical protein
MDVLTDTQLKHQHGDIYIGLDLGTSGCRAIAIDEHEQVLAEIALPFPQPAELRPSRQQDPWQWWDCAKQALLLLGDYIDTNRICAIAVDGTSSTLMVTDRECQPFDAALMYHDARSVAEAAQIATIAPANSGAHGATSSLAKLLYLQQQHQHQPLYHAMHQSDWITSLLSGLCGISDENNCLKLGYDIVNRCWPDWLNELAVNRRLLPKVVPPGTLLGPLLPEMAAELRMPSTTQIISGTTDGVAAFLATGAHEVGDAVTSLGSTMVIKVLSDTPIFAPEYGVYSHRLGDHWLVGGASNCGGATLLKFFTRQQLEQMTPALQPEQATGLNYYPLPDTGERFPISDTNKQAELSPRPADDIIFFQAMLEGMARVEADAYALLAELGAPAIKTIYTVGGGASNTAWRRIRQNHLQARFMEPRHLQAAYGTALLARHQNQILQTRHNAPHRHAT